MREKGGNKGQYNQQIKFNCTMKGVKFQGTGEYRTSFLCVCGKCTSEGLHDQIDCFLSDYY